MRNIKLLILFLIAILPFSIVKPVFAGFGVSPAEIYNDNLKPGAKFEKEIVLSRSDSTENLKIVIETDLNETESWIKFEPSKEFVFPKGQNRKTIKVIVDVPNNAQLKTYKGLLRIKASSMDSSSSGVSIVQGARMEVNLVTTSFNVDLLNIKGLLIPSVDFQKPIKLLVNIENNGNTDTAPSKIILEIQNLTQTAIETQEVTKLDKVAPNTTKEITAEFKNNLGGGSEYFGIVKVYLGDKLLRSDRLVFKVGAAPEGYNPSQGKSPFSKLIYLIKQNKLETLAIILIIAVPIIAFFILSKKSKFKKNKKIFLIATAVYLVVSIALLSLFHQIRLKNMAKPGDKGNVQGESVEVKQVENSNNGSQSPLIINEPKATYPVYRTPDATSEVVYQASENEKFSVLEQIDGWYRVSTGKGTGGWLPQNSIKKSE